jgi:opacity protein-like surface antigen
MTRFRLLLAVALSLCAVAASAQVVDPREQSYQFYVDGVLTPGIIGYQITFNHSTVSRADARQLDSAYSPDQRILSVSVTQKGLNRLQDWLNSATNTGAPPTKNLSLVVRLGDSTVLVRWEFTGVTPTTVGAQGTGSQSEVDATVGFYFTTMNQVQAKAD